ncbi:MAG TPA: hypothetical protein VJ851_04395 [Jatrophihabitans sp.]|nr:hypothetical protein [Jatrophihabitans sp.]
MTGAVTGTSIPLVELPELDPPELPVLIPVGVPQVAEAAPNRPTPLPQTVNGAVIGTATAALEPVVVLPEPADPQLAEADPMALPQIVTGAVTGIEITARGAVVGVLAGWPVLAVACEWPSSAMALPLTVTGALTGASSTDPPCVELL